MQNTLKKGKKLYVILGNTVAACHLAENELPNSKYLKIIFNNKDYFKQRNYCFLSELEALDDLKHRLEKSLEITETKISKIVNKQK
jgi:hypothetical protein